MNPPVLILGSGLAGYTLAREWRKLDRATPLVIVSRDHAGFYSKPMLSNALSGKKTADSLIMKTAAQMTADLNAEILAHTEVTAIAPALHQVTLTDGRTLAYRSLVIAAGADPLRLALTGDGAADVISVNDLDDFRRFSERLTDARRVAILGGGLIGCEFANDLLARAIVPSVIDLGAWPLGRLLPETAGREALRRLTAAGVDFHLGTSVARIDRAGDGYRLTLADGSAVDADLVLSAIGLRPRTALATAAGLAVNRGIVVDRRLASSAADIYAIGDCAEVAGCVLPFVQPIMQQAKALAATLAGTPSEVVYPAMPVVVKTPACPTVVCPPPPDVAGSWQSAADGDGLAAEYRSSDGHLRGFVLLGLATARKQALTAQMPPQLAT
jgi:rubredoxin---NAD+ reductase